MYYFNKYIVAFDIYVCYNKHIEHKFILWNGDAMKGKKYWIACPKCGSKMLMVREDTKLLNFPGYCKHCKEESIISLEPMSRVAKSVMV